jgi:hypothetical protein
MKPVKCYDFTVKLSVVIPVYNERATIRELLAQAGVPRPE